MPEEEKRKSDFAEKLSNWATAFRDGIIVLLLLLLLLFPSCVNSQLEKAGFTEADIAGFHWEKELQEMSEQTEEAQEQVQLVEESIDSIRRSLITIADDVRSPEIRAQVDQLAVRLDSSLVNVRSVDRDLKASMRVQEEILERVPERGSIKRRIE